MHRPRAALVALALACALPVGAAGAEPYDLVIAGGRVMDPESGRMPTSRSSTPRA